MDRKFIIFTFDSFFLLMRWKYGSVRLSKKKIPAFNTKNWFFGVHFRFWGKFSWIPMKLTPLPYQFFRAFYSIRKCAVRRTIELSGSNFRIKNWSLYVELRFSRVECTWSIKICSFSFFRIWSAIAQQITRDLCKYCTSFGVFIRLELDVQLHLHFPPPPLSMQKPTSRNQTYRKFGVMDL